MKTLVPLLLCLLPVLVEADSHIVPYLTFMGNNIPNHSYVDLNTVGSALNGLDSVQCHTDLKTCCNRPQDRDRGSWYFPSGKRLNFFGGGVVYENRTDKRIDLRYLREGGASGMYRCDIETTSVNERAGWETAYVGLYNRGGDVTIPGGVTLTVKPDGNGDSPQFIFTCISIGGPATTVTWTRNSETVSGGMTVLDNAVTAQYTHTLTVTGRLGGQYQCTVANNKPSNATATYIFKSGAKLASEKETEPQIFRLVENQAVAGSNSPYKLEFVIVPVVTRGARFPKSTVDGQIVKEYLVEWKRDTSRKCPDYKDEGNYTVDADTTNLKISGLKADSTYFITVTAINKAGKGIKSLHITKSTLTAAPSAAPIVNVTEVTTYNITVVWGEVNCIDQNGNIKGYKVHYGVNGNENSSYVPGGSSTTHTIIGLYSANNYSIKVAAKNKVGFGVYSNRITATTLTRALVVTVVHTTYENIKINWTKTGRKVDSWDIMVKRVTLVECGKIEYNTSIPDGYEGTIGGLDAFSIYTITVVESSTEGNEVSNSVNARTNETAPSASPTDVHAYFVTSSSITLRWQLVDRCKRNGIITGYKVQYWVVDGIAPKQTVCFSGGSTTNEVIPGLDAATNYSIEVSAVNSAGIGKYSPAINVTTRESFVYPDNFWSDSIVGHHLDFNDAAQFTISLPDDGSKSLCYGMHGSPNDSYNIISDTCTSVNVHFTQHPARSNENRISSIGIRAVTADADNPCADIQIDLLGCKATINNSQIIEQSIIGNVSVRKYSNRWEVFVQNCDRPLAVMYIICEVDMLRFVVLREFNLRSTSHGLLGQFWNVPITVTDTGGAVYVIDVSGNDGNRTFCAIRKEYTYHDTHRMCYYAYGNHTNIIAGNFNMYKTPSLFDTDYEYTQFVDKSGN